MSNKEQREYRKRSQDMRQAVIGTHVAANSKRASRTKVDFSNHRGANRANRGTINHVTPRTSSYESSSAHSRRMRHSGFAMQAAKRSRTRGIIVAIIIVLAVCAVAAGVTWFVFTSSITNKVSLNDSSATAALTAVSSESDPYYVLVAGEYSDAKQTYDGPNLLVLMRVDPSTHVVEMLSIPASIETTLSDNKTHTISQAQTVGGDAELIKTVSSLTGVSISHYLKTDATKFKALVDELGGVTVDVKQEVDDPDAGSVYIPTGTQTLDGESALVLCRADNYLNSVTTRSTAQTDVLCALLDKLLEYSGMDLATTLDSVSNYFKTDMSFDQLTSLAKAFGSVDEATVYQTSVPGSLSVETDGTYFSVSKTSFANVMSAIEAGDDPNAKGVAAAIDPSQVSVTVKNGAGVTGGASQVGSALSDYGFKVESTGNTDSYVYSETLVVYNDADKEASAETVVGLLGAGRTVSAGIYYTFDTDLMVIIGKDWKPLS